MPPDAPGSVDAAMRGRRTIHRFRPDPVPTPAILRALESARWAPNHRLTEPWRFVLPGRETAATLAEHNAALVAARRGDEAARLKRLRWLETPAWIVVTCRRSPDPLREREDYAACCCAVQNAMLSLWAAGIGSKWGTGEVTRSDDGMRILGVDPEHEFIVALLAVGYPDEVPETARRPLDAVLTELP